MTGWDPWEERDWRRAVDCYLNNLEARSFHQRGPLYANVDPEPFLFDRMGPGPDGYAFGGAAYGAHRYGPGRYPYSNMGAGAPIDIDTLVMRMLESYRILDELFGPRIARANPSAETGNPQSGSAQGHEK